MWLSAISLAVHFVADPPPSLKSQKPPRPNNGLQFSDLNSIDLHFSQSSFQLNHKDLSPWSSLMARARPLGPSVAPWPVETSTAHGVSSLLVLVFLSGMVKSFWSSPSASGNTLSLVLPLLQPPEKRSSPQISLTSPVSRRLHILHVSTKTKLGFLLAGLDSNFGPLTLLKPKPIKCNPNLQSLQFRSVPTSFMSL
ncbi:unnamed protein product [Arabidopsis halleri]